MRIPNRGDYAYFKQTGQDYKMKNLEKQLEGFENGSRYQKMEEEIESLKLQLDREKKRGQKALRKQEKEYERKIRLWKQSADDVAEERDRAKAKAEKYKEKYQQVKAERDELASELEQARRAIRKLVHRLGLDHRNSHKPSSMDPIGARRKDLRQNNSRRSSGRARGAQHGHPHHPRRKLEPNAEPVLHDGRPAGTENEDGWYRTDRTVTKLEVVPRVVVDVVPHVVSVWRNRLTGAEKYSPYPPRLKDEVNYSPAAGVLYLMLTQFGNVAARKAQLIMSSLTNGVLNPSHGWIAGLPRKFAERSAQERQGIFAELFQAPYLNVDTTVTKNDGKREALSVAACEAIHAVYYAHTQKKGKAAADSLPCAAGLGYDGTVISDREPAYKVLGRWHQLCLAHLLRDLQSVMEMEKDRLWPKEMADLFREMIHASHQWTPEAGPTDEEVRSWEQRYDEILMKGRAEYCQNPPTADYLEGHNLRAALAEASEQVLRFLHDPSIPPTNNAAERLLRIHKRALHQKVTFRSSESIDNWCAFMTVVMTHYMRGENLCDVITEILERSLTDLTASAGLNVADIV